VGQFIRPVTVINILEEGQDFFWEMDVVFNDSFWNNSLTAVFLSVFGIILGFYDIILCLLEPDTVFSMKIRKFIKPCAYYYIGCDNAMLFWENTWTNISIFMHNYLSSYLSTKLSVFGTSRHFE